ncbi:MAG TPA: class I SAM-dependent methyltransferase [Sphingobacteriaceae bacterium]|nr:class I SAM-dependent methyltransferase [Sphingobacteriaceae bacterium]
MAPKEAWYEDFFDEYYRAAHREYEEEFTTTEVFGALSLLDLSPGAHILDVPCGTGRHSVAFAAAGYTVTGVDLSAQALALARERAAAAGRAEQIQWVRADMRRLPWTDHFDGVACLFNSFGYLGDEGDTQALAAMVGAVKPGGPILLDLPNRDYYLGAVPPAYWQETADHWLLCSFNFDYVTGVAETDYTFVAKNPGPGSPPVVQRKSFVRWYTLPEIRKMLAEAGAQVEEAVGDWDGRAVDGEAPKIIVLARKGA